MTHTYRTSLVVGAGTGLSASLARRFAAAGIRVGLAARNPDKLAPLCAEIGAKAYACDAQDEGQVGRLFDDVARDLGAPDVVVFNAGARLRGPFATLDAGEVRRTLLANAFAGFLVARRAVPAMLEKGSGALLFTGASASVKGYANSAPFAMGKFGLRGLAQSMARELAPKNIHVAHFVIDGGIGRPGSDPRAAERGEDSLLAPEAIAETYLHIHRQHRSAWTWEVELRPWLERF